MCVKGWPLFVLERFSNVGKIGWFRKKIERFQCDGWLRSDVVHLVFVLYYTKYDIIYRLFLNGVKVNDVSLKISEFLSN